MNNRKYSPLKRVALTAAVLLVANTSLRADVKNAWVGVNGAT